MNKHFKILGIGLAFCLLVLIRVFETKLFYDPFISYYKTMHFSSGASSYDLTKILAHTFLRYLSNSLISIYILFIAFRKTEIVRFAMLFYSVLFILLISLYTAILLNFSNELKQVFFYIRRFLIQPIFVIILLPAFYYQQKIITKK